VTDVFTFTKCGCGIIGLDKQMYGQTLPGICRRSLSIERLRIPERTEHDRMLVASVRARV